MALSALLSFGAVARDALGPRLERAAAAGAARFPVSIVYGGANADWMLRVSPGAGPARALRARGVDAQVFYTPRAGHNLQMENPEGFAAHIVARCA